MARETRSLLVVLSVLAVLPLRPAAGQTEHEWKDGKWVPVAAPAEGTAAGELALIRNHADAGRHGKVVKLADAFVGKYPGDPSREEVMLLAGEAEMGRGRYYQAFEWFNKQLNEFPAGRYYERALDREFRVGEAFLAGKKRIVGKVIRLPATDEGLEILSRIAEQAPGSAIAEKALLRIGDHHYAKGEYLDAAGAYDNFLELFGKSGHVPYAMLQAARAIYASFDGVDYEETPLIEAAQRLQAFQVRYPEAAQKADAEEMLRRITDLRAEKAYATGQFYERTRRASAAAFYYRQVIDGYPQTQWAAKAAIDLQRLGSVSPAQPQPAQPARRLAPTTEGKEGWIGPAPRQTTTSPVEMDNLPGAGQKGKAEE